MMQVHHSTAGATALLLLASLGAPAASQERPSAGSADPVIRGEAYDSTRGVALSRADVYVWETAYRATTDALGRFEISGVPPGDYSVVLYHPRLVELGVSTLSRPIRVPDRGEVRVSLGIPSNASIAESTCAGQSREDHSGIAEGLVRDAETGVPLAGARVILTWKPEGEPTQRYESKVDRQGRYQLCGLPTGVGLGANAEFLNRVGFRREVTIPPEGVLTLDFNLSDFRPSVVTGTLLDQDTKEPVTDAEVELVGTSFTSVSDENGQFRFAGVPAGVYTVAATHLAYGTRSDTVDVGNGLNLHVDIPLAVQPIDLEPITVTVLTDANEVRLAMGGTTIGRDAIERVRERSRDVGDLLRAQNVPGLVVSRSAATLCIGFAPGQARMFRDGRCESVVVYVDGVRAVNPRVAADIPASIIDEMVIFRPVEAGNLFGLGGGNGVLMIYTKRGRR